MSTTLCLSSKTLHQEVAEEQDFTEPGAAWPAEGGAGLWTTRQVLAACLWSALFGLLCGYGWLFFHVSQGHM